MSSWCRVGVCSVIVVFEMPVLKIEGRAISEVSDKRVVNRRLRVADKNN